MVDSIYVDSNVFIFPIIGEDSVRAKCAKNVLTMIEKERFTAFTSILTWDEVCWVVTRLLGAPDGTLAGRKLLSFPHLHFVDVSSLVMGTAQSLMERYAARGLAPRDAIHCSSAIAKRATAIVSDDRGLDVVVEVKRTPLEEFGNR